MKSQVTKKEILHEVAKLESINDQLVSELQYVDQLMKLVGFAEGIETLKATAQELIKLEDENRDAA